MLLTATFAFAASFSAITQVFVLGLEELTHETFLDPEGRFHLAWRYNETSIDIEYTAATRGWMAFALSPNGGMNQSDVMIAWIDLNGETVIQVINYLAKKARSFFQSKDGLVCGKGMNEQIRGC